MLPLNDINLSKNLQPYIDFILKNFAHDLNSDDSIYIGGSFAAGLGNSSSDIDVYILRARTKSKFEGKQLFHERRRIDCHDMPLEEFKQLLNSLDKNHEINQSLLGTIYRIIHGIHICGVEKPEFHNYENALKKSLQRACFKRTLTAWNKYWILRASGFETLCRSQEIILINEFTYLLLACENELYPGIKWNYEKVERSEFRERIENNIDEIKNSLSSHDEALTVKAINTILQSAGIETNLEQFKWKPNCVGEVFYIAENGYIKIDSDIYHMNTSMSYMISLMDGTRYLDEIHQLVSSSYDGSFARIKEDINSIVIELLGLGILIIDNDLPISLKEHEILRPSTNAFEPEILEKNNINTFVALKSERWLRNVEILSLLDDFSGAKSAGQIGAQLSALRSIATHSSALFCIPRGEVAIANNELLSFRNLYGEESELYQALIKALVINRSKNLTTEMLEPILENILDFISSFPELDLFGDLMKEEGHKELFVFLNDICEFAKKYEIRLPFEKKLIQKAYDVAIYG